ncbi:MAG TPA: S1 RNA-binding domain-containing protein, partial [Salinibacter sp.]|nr:S1 RNA-binding domain-containing protein [Salinibacter sp.]
MAEKQEQVASPENVQDEPQDDDATPPPEAADETASEADTDASADAEEPDTEASADASPAEASSSDADAEDANAEDEDASADAPADDSSDDSDAEASDEDGGEQVAPEDPVDQPKVVSRLLEEAVEEASKDMRIPTGDETEVELSEMEEPAASSASFDELERTEENQGFTGEPTGRTVSLDELEAEEDTYSDDPVYDQFRALIDETAIDVREQDIVEGRVLRVDEDFVVVDIGYKSDGIVPRDEFGDTELHPGDTVEVYLELKEDRDGQLVLSKEKADKVRRWQRVEEIYENEE